VPRVDIPSFDDARCRIVEDTKPEVVSFHFGLPDSMLLARVKAVGCHIMASATTVAEALWLETRGVDIIIAQGSEAGGHRGTFLAQSLSSASSSQPGTLALVPQVVDAVKVPVVAAGGIADGRGIAAAFALGAAGTQLGTAYLLCPEAATSEFIGMPCGMPIRTRRLLPTFSRAGLRALSNRLGLEIGPILDALPDFPLPMGALAPLRAKAEQQGNRRADLDLCHPAARRPSTNKTGGIGENVSMLSKPSVRSLASISVTVQGWPPLRTIRNLVSVWPSSSGGGG
jgi:nitronate monooxygenase